MSIGQVAAGAGHQLTPSIAQLKGGGYVIAWASDPSSSGLVPFDVCFQRYDANDQAVGAVTCVAGAHRSSAGPYVIARANGGFTLLWNESGNSADGSGLHWQDFDASGTAIGAIQSGALPLALDATPLAGGGYVQLSKPAGQDFISFQLYAADGTPIGSPQPVGDTNGLAPDPHLTYAGGAVGLADGGFAVVWSQPDGSSSISMTRAFSPDGTPRGDPVVVAPNTLGPVNCGRYGVVAMCGAFQNIRGFIATQDGGYIVVWQDGTGIATSGDTFARQFLATGSPANTVVGRIVGTSGGMSAAATNSHEFALVTYGDGAVAVARVQEDALR